jgi:hypothetical protein
MLCLWSWLRTLRSNGREQTTAIRRWVSLKVPRYPLSQFSLWILKPKMSTILIEFYVHKVALLRVHHSEFIDERTVMFVHNWELFVGQKAVSCSSSEICCWTNICYLSDTRKHVSDDACSMLSLVYYVWHSRNHVWHHTWAKSMLTVRLVLRRTWIPSRRKLSQSAMWS